MKSQKSLVSEDVYCFAVYRMNLSGAASGKLCFCKGACFFYGYKKRFHIFKTPCRENVNVLIFMVTKKTRKYNVYLLKTGLLYFNFMYFNFRNN